MNKCRILGWHFKFLKHGFYLSQSVGNIDADISGKHQDFAAFTGSNFGAITEKNATI
jgi:hypothetical protein